MNSMQKLCKVGQTQQIVMMLLFIKTEYQ